MLRRDFEEGRKVVLQTQIFCFCLKTAFIQPEKKVGLYYTPTRKKSMIEKPLFSNQKKNLILHNYSSPTWRKIQDCRTTFLAHSKSFLRMQIKRLIGYHWESFGHLLKILVEDPFGIRWGSMGFCFCWLGSSIYGPLLGLLWFFLVDFSDKHEIDQSSISVVLPNFKLFSLWELVCINSFYCFTRFTAPALSRHLTECEGNVIMPGMPLYTGNFDQVEGVAYLRCHCTVLLSTSSSLQHMNGLF